MLVGFYPWDRSAANHISASIFTSSCQLVQMEAEIGLATQDYLLVTTEGRLDLLWSATPVSFVQQKIQCVTVRLVVMMSSCGTASLGLLKFQTIFDCTRCFHPSCLSRHPRTGCSGVDSSCMASHSRVGTCCIFLTAVLMAQGATIVNAAENTANTVEEMLCVFCPFLL